MEKLKFKFRQEQSIDGKRYEDILNFEANGQRTYRNDDWILDFIWLNEQEEVQILIDYADEEKLLTFREISDNQKLYLLLPLDTSGEGYLKTIHGLLSWETRLNSMKQQFDNDKEIWQFDYTLTQDGKNNIYQRLTLIIDKF